MAADKDRPPNKKVSKKIGRPKGARDKKPRKMPAKDVSELQDQLTIMSKRMDGLQKENKRLTRGFETNPLHLGKDPLAEDGKGLTEEQLSAIAAGEDLPDGELPMTGSQDEVDALHFRRSQVQRLLLRGVPHKTIATFLKMKPSTLKADIQSIRKRWREQVNTYDITEAIGESLSFYREIRDINLRIATDTTIDSVSDKITASRSALTAEDSKNNFLRMLGVYDILDAERREAFIGERESLDNDSEDFSKVINFMAHAQRRVIEHNPDPEPENDFDDIPDDGADEA